MALTLGTLTPSTQGAVTAVAAPGTVATAERAPRAHCTWGREWDSGRGTPLPTLSILWQRSNSSLQAESWAQPCYTFPREVGHDQQLSAGSSTGSWDRRKSKGGVTSKEAI